MEPGVLSKSPTQSYHVSEDRTQHVLDNLIMEKLVMDSLKEDV